MSVQLRAKIATLLAAVILTAIQYPIYADTNLNPPLIAQANIGGTGALAGDIAVAGATLGKKRRKEAVMTDSLWGNLILDMAFQRDSEIKKIMKRLNIVNLGTMGVVSAVAGGTLAQGIITLATLNPQQGNDTYLPGAIGIGMAGLTLVTFAGRAAINHCLMKQMRQRQLVIKHQVEGILAKFESSHGDNADVQAELASLIGEKATNEWSQLWRSANVLASVKEPSISLLPGTNLRNTCTPDAPLHRIYDHALTSGTLAEAQQQ